MTGMCASCALCLCWGPAPGRRGLLLQGERARFPWTLRNIFSLVICSFLLQMTNEQRKKCGSIWASRVATTSWGLRCRGPACAFVRACSLLACVLGELIAPRKSPASKLMELLCKHPTSLSLSKRIVWHIIYTVSQRAKCRLSSWCFW